MAYVLEKILTVRKHRENRRFNELVKSKEAVKLAKTVQDQKKQELHDFQEWRQLEERRQFDSLKHKTANVHDVMYFTDTLDTLRQDQAVKARHYQEASVQVTSAEMMLHKARQQYARACQKKMKITEHKEIWMEDHRVLMEQKEEDELEEFAQTPLQRGELL